MHIDGIEQIVIPVRDLQQSIEFYTEILDFEVKNKKLDTAVLTSNNSSIKLIGEKSNIEFRPHNFQPGTLEFTLTTKHNINEIVTILGAKGILLLEGPIEEKSVNGLAQSVYFRDPDKNLIKVLSYDIIDIKNLETA